MKEKLIVPGTPVASEIINLVPYAEHAIPDSLVSWIEGNRQRDITRNAKKRLGKVAKDHNAKYARAA
jgi:hypothetical protein